MKTFLRALAVLLVILAVVVAAASYSIVRRGLSTRAEPTWAEVLLARTMRRLATPQATRAAVNPLQASPEVLGEALEHYADHCATCHANDGSGDTEIGRNLYPRAPDMRARPTQDLSDGELFAIIEHGIRLTGMPGWGTGTPEGERASWGLVHFIRRLPRLTEDEISRMEALNPKSAEEWREQEEIRRFLSGEDAPLPPAAPHEHGGSRRP